jgi:integrative and conjugative element protein (TIGR02256 family)
MAVSYVEAPGAVIPRGDVKLAMSLSLCAFLTSRLRSHAALVEVRRTAEENEVVVFEVEVEVSQVRRFNIQPRERLAVIFRKTEELNPEVLALRKDFPYVPHLNPRDEEIPRSLCLYEESFDELKLTWTPSAFVERVRWWLSETAKGTLHGDDQPLEPILLGNFPPLVLPSNFIDRMTSGEGIQTLSIEHRQGGSQPVYVAVAGNRAPTFVAFCFTCPPHVHGVIRTHPRNLARLNEILESTGFHLIEELRGRVAEWDSSVAPLHAHTIVVTLLPKQREAGAEPETYELWAFHISKTVGALGVALGILGRYGNSFGRVLGGASDTQEILGTLVDVLNPTLALSRKGAAALNGNEPRDLKLAAIGLGALGSHLVNNLVRAGFGIWIGIDQDVMLPHNAARHELGQSEVGWLKVQGMQAHLNATLDEAAMPAILDADFLRPGPREPELLRMLSGSDAILDFSASLPVARKLAYYPAGETRRCSVFLNPSGTDLVLLCEDQKREIRLDWLEFMYYRELLGNVALDAHFNRETGRVRYARSCRDLASRVPQHLVAMHAGIASRALHECLPKAGAIVRIWHSDPSMNVQSHDVKASPVLDMEINSWRVCTDEVFAGKLQKYRKAKLPKETGGVLLGGFDQDKRIVYLVDVIPSPKDSDEWPTHYIRGTEGLQRAVVEAGKRTDNLLQYVGEWHSHPNGYTTDPSKDDKQLFRWLEEHAARDSNPPVMIIVGEKETRVFINSVQDWAMLKAER